jgi:hypothetical protein
MLLYPTSKQVTKYFKYYTKHGEYLTYSDFTESLLLDERESNMAIRRRPGKGLQLAGKSLYLLKTVLELQL